MTQVLVIAVVAAIMFFVGLSMRRAVPEPESKTFGLEEARRARALIKTPEQAEAVKAVVVGVLNYEDTVAEEAEDAADELERAKGSNIHRISTHEDEIEALEVRIAALHASNDGIDSHTADLAALRSMFA